MFPGILQSNCWDLYSCQPDHYAFYVKVLRQKEAVRYTVPVEDRVWECLMIPTPDGGCQGIGVERTREHNLKEQWEVAIRSCPFAIATVAPNGLMLDCAPAWEKILGFNPTGKRYQEFTHPDDIAADVNLHFRMMEGEFDSYSLMKRYIHADGHIVHVLLESGIIRSTGISLAYVTDITRDVAMQEQQRLQGEISTAILEEEFELHYQPICLLATGERVGYEALVRWRKNGEILPPARFLGNLGERTIGLLTFEVLRMAIRDREYLRPHPTAVNLDPRSLKDKAFGVKLKRFLEVSHIDPIELQFEITEQYLMDVPLVELLLRSLAEDGFQLKVDDLGSHGYSNLSLLTLDYFSGVKIDKSLTDKIYDPTEGRRTQKLLSTLLLLTERLNLDVVVEGIEAEEQVKWLLNNGYEKGQGYFFSRPLPLSEILESEG